MNTSAATLATTFHLIFGVHVQHANRGAAHVGLADDKRSLPLEVIGPDMGARIEELNRVGRILRRRIDTGQIAGLPEIAIDASQRQVGWLIRSSVLLWNDVLNLQSG